MARCPVLLPCHPIVRKNVFPLGCLAFNKLANFDKNCFAGIFSASSSGSVSNNYMLAKTADSAERGKSMFSFYQRERIKWQTGKAEFNFNSQAHPSVPFYSIGAPQNNPTGLQQYQQPRVYVADTGSCWNACRGKLFSAFSCMGPFALSLLSPAPGVMFISPHLRKQALDRKGGSRRLGIKDPEPSPRSSFSW